MPWRILIDLDQCIADSNISRLIVQFAWYNWYFIVELDFVLIQMYFYTIGCPNDGFIGWIRWSKVSRRFPFWLSYCCSPNRGWMEWRWYKTNITLRPSELTTFNKNFKNKKSQIGKGPSIWDQFTHDNPDLIADHSNADVGPNSYHFFEDDIKAMKDLGVI